MVDQPIILNRQILESFLPNYEAIKAFESLFRIVTQEIPEQNDDIEAVIASLKSSSTSIQNLQISIDVLEQNQQRTRSLLSDVAAALENIQVEMQNKNLRRETEIEQRLKNIETFIGI